MPKYKLFFSFMIATFHIDISAQVDCPGENDPCPQTPWTNETFYDFVGSPGVHLKFNTTYKWRYCNGQFQMKDFQITTDYINFFNELNHYEKALNGLKEHAEIEALASLIGKILSGSLENFYYCDDSEPGHDPVLFASIYSADCGVWLRCSYEFDCEPTIYADGPSQTNHVCESPWDRNGKKVVDRWHWEPCGEVCCEKTYEICSVVDVVNGGYIYKINNVDRHKLVGSECSKEGQFFKWDTGTPIPCQDGCQGDGN